MKKLTPLILFALLVPVGLAAQFDGPCLPEGISFTTQEQIDNFKANYPDCTEIEGDLKIGRWTGTDITNLNGLSELTSIGGILEIWRNDSLVSLKGLENLIFIGGELWIFKNNGLLSLAALQNLDESSIANLYVYDNPSLNDCEVQFLCNYLASPYGTVNIYNNAIGCNAPHEISNSCGNTQPCLPFGNYYFLLQSDVDNFQLNYPGCTEPAGKIYIKGNDIQNLYGLDVVTSINGRLIIHRADSLPDLIGLNNLSLIKGRLIISDNDFLSSLIGLDNLTSIDSGFTISNNNSLTSFTGMDTLISVRGYFDIIGNDTLESLEGLESMAIVNNLSFQGNNLLNNLSALQNLDTINGILRINSNDGLTNLEGLNNVLFIGRDLLVYGNDSLIDFTGLDNLNSVSDRVSIWGNESLNSFSGLENLTTIGAELTIGWWHQYPHSPYGNPSLTSIEGLHNLTSIGGTLRVEDNDLLSNLAGLENIEPNPLGNLHIHHNDNLSMCEIESICDYLVSPGGTVEIYENAPGCNSQEEVLDSCDFSAITDYGLTKLISVNPNPFSTSTTIEYESTQPGNVELKIYNQLGELVEIVQKATQAGKQVFNWDTSNLPSGIYFIRLQTGEEVFTRKVIKL